MTNHQHAANQERLRKHPCTTYVVFG